MIRSGVIMNQEDLEKEVLHEYSAALAAQVFGKDLKKHIKKLEGLEQKAEKLGYIGVAIFTRGRIEKLKTS
jgi:hypothetical protein